MTRRKKIFPKISIFVLAMVLTVATITQPVVFATEEKNVYEDLYAKDGVIGMRDSEDFYEAIYVLNDDLNEKVTVTTILYFVVQDNFNVEQNDFTYRFEGSFAPVEKYGTHKFEVDLGMPVEYKPLNTELTIGGEPVTLYQARFGMYPGYYTFYNFGYNFVGSGAGTACFIKTLSPNWKVTEKDKFTQEQWVEISETSSDPRLYAIIGEKEWVEQIEKSFETWAKEYESKVLKNIVSIGEEEAIEVEVPEENKEEMLQKVEDIMENQQVAIEEEIPDVFEAKTSEVPVQEKTNNSVIFVSIIGVVVLIFGGLFVASFIKDKRNKY